MKIINQTENAKITNVSLTMEDHGCLTFWLTLEGKGWGVGYGGYCIGNGFLGANDFSGYAKGLEAMMRIMDVVGVAKWEDLTGKYIRVMDVGWGSTITKIGNLIEDKWFDISEFFSEEKHDG